MIHYSTEKPKVDHSGQKLLYTCIKSCPCFCKLYDVTMSISIVFAYLLSSKIFIKSFKYRYWIQVPGISINTTYQYKLNVQVTKVQNTGKAVDIWCVKQEAAHRITEVV